MRIRTATSDLHFPHWLITREGHVHHRKHLIVALAAAARLWTDRIGSTALISVVIGTASCVLGLGTPTRGDLAAGGTTTLLIAVFFLVITLSPYSGRPATLQPGGGRSPATTPTAPSRTPIRSRTG
jgi:hypothetical protein